MTLCNQGFSTGCCSRLGRSTLYVLHLFSKQTAETQFYTVSSDELLMKKRSFMTKKELLFTDMCLSK